MSYCGTLHFGITGDFDAMPDLDVLAKGVQAGLDELVRAADGARPAEPRTR